jgi:molecular chaperone DnaJ
LTPASGFKGVCSRLTEHQRQLLREFETISQQDSARHNPRAKGWFDKVKEFFEVK